MKIEITPDRGDMSTLSLLLSDSDELRADVAEELASMIRLNRKKGDGKTISSTSHRLHLIDVTIHSKG